jgi:hypothetical protein
MTTPNPQAKKPDFFESAPTEKSGFFDPGTPPTREPKAGLVANERDTLLPRLMSGQLRVPTARNAQKSGFFEP